MTGSRLTGLILIGGSLVLLALKSMKTQVRHHSFIDPAVNPRASDLMLQLRDVHGVKGSFWMGPLQGNGVRDSKHEYGSRSTFIYIPPHFDADEPYEVIFFFHGLTGYFKNTDGNYGHRVTMAIKEMDDAGRNYILVFPELVWSHFTSTPKGRQRVVFDGSSEENFETFYREVIATIENHFGITVAPYRTVMIGHSAGGSALRAIAVSGMMDRLRPESVLWSDSAYGSWLDEFHRNFRNQSNTKVTLFNVVDPSSTKPWQRTQAFLRSIGGTPSNYEIVPLKYSEGWSHRKIGDNILQMSSEY